MINLPFENIYISLERSGICIEADCLGYDTALIVFDKCTEDGYMLPFSPYPLKFAFAGSAREILSLYQQYIELKDFYFVVWISECCYLPS